MYVKMYHFAQFSDRDACSAEAAVEVVGCIARSLIHNWGEGPVEDAVVQRDEDGDAPLEGIKALIASAVGPKTDKPEDVGWRRSLRDEVRTYKVMAVESGTGDVVAFWKQHGTKLPLLAAVACIALTSPASSTPSERVFSLAGLVRTKLRARLSPLLTESCVRVGSYFRKSRQLE